MPALRWQTNSNSAQPDHHTGLLIDAAEVGDAAAIEDLIASGGDINAPTKGGTTPLMIAAIFGHAAVVRLLLDRGAAINETRSDGFNALAFAAFFGHEEVVRELLVRGADIHAKSRGGTSAEMWAVARGFTDVAELLKQSKERFPVLVTANKAEAFGRKLHASAVPRLPEKEKEEAELYEVRQKEPENSVEASSADFNPANYSQEGLRRMGPVEAPQELHTTFEYDLPPVAPFSPLSTLIGRLSESRKHAPVFVGLMLAASSIFAVAAVWKNNAKSERSLNDPAPAVSIPTVELNQPSVESAPPTEAAEQTEPPVNTPTETPVNAPVAAKSAEAIADHPTNSDDSRGVERPAVAESQPITIERPRLEKQPVARTLSPYNRVPKRLPAINRQEKVVSESTPEATSETRRPASVTFVAKPATPQPRKAEPANDAPVQPASPLQGNSMKKKVIQWP